MRKTRVTTTNAKLRLGRETIRALETSELGYVAGGVTQFNCEKTQIGCPTLQTCAQQGCLG